MPIKMSGSPSPPTSPEFLSYGAAPHGVPREAMVFDAALGGWISNPEVANALRLPAAPDGLPLWTAPTGLTPKGKSTSDGKHFEIVHQGGWKLDMAKEVELGLVPPDWSVTSKMDDSRPNGKGIFDARFIESPVGRAAAGRSMVWDARGTAHAGKTEKAQNWDAGAMAEAAERELDGMAHEVDPMDGCQ